MSKHGNTITNKLAGSKLDQNDLKNFFDQFEVEDVLTDSGIKKHHNAKHSAFSIFTFLISLLILGSTIFAVRRNGRKEDEISQSTAYEFNTDPKSNWARFTLKLAVRVIEFVKKCYPNAEVNELVVDDTSYERPKAKKVEFWSYIFDHVKHKSLKGYQLLTVGWTNGIVFIPLTYVIVASQNDNKVGCIVENHEITQENKIQRDAQKQKPDLLIEMVKRILKTGLSVVDITFDSWFPSKKVVSSLVDLGLNVVCSVKRNGNTKYLVGGELLTVKQILWKYQDDILINRADGTILVMDVELVLTEDDCKPKRKIYARNIKKVTGKTRHYQKKKRKPPKAKTIKVRLFLMLSDHSDLDYIALMTTNLSYTALEVDTIYRARWKTEVFYYHIKNTFHLQKQCRAVKLQAIYAHIARICVLYMIVSLQAVKLLDSDQTFLQDFVELQKETQSNEWKCVVLDTYSCVEDALKELMDLNDEQIEIFFELVFHNYSPSVKDFLELQLPIGQTKEDIKIKWSNTFTNKP